MLKWLVTTGKYLCSITGFTTVSYLLLAYWIYLLKGINSTSCL